MGSSEFDLLAALRPLLDGDGAILGPGDDAAVVAVGGTPVAVTVDAVVEGVHADLAWSTAQDLGWRALAVNVSDLAAIGATPIAAVMALLRPDDLDDEVVLDLYRGLRAAADEWGVLLVGGDITRGAQLSVAVTLVGALAADAPLTRGGARPGDVVAAVGPLGQAGAALAALRAGRGDLLEAHPDLGACLRRPRAWVEAGAALARLGAHACIDVSDGLGQDAGHVAAASEARIVLEAERLVVAPGVAAVAEALGVDPLRFVVGGGDDHALVATLPAGLLARFEDGHDVTAIGRVEDGAGIVLERPDGSTEDVSRWGWEHGRERTPDDTEPHP